MRDHNGVSARSGDEKNFQLGDAAAGIGGRDGLVVGIQKIECRLQAVCAGYRKRQFLTGVECDREGVGVGRIVD